MPITLNSVLMLPGLGGMKMFIAYPGLATNHTKPNQTKPKHSMKGKTMLISFSLQLFPRKVITEDLVPTGSGKGFAFYSLTYL